MQPTPVPANEDPNPAIASPRRSLFAFLRPSHSHTTTSATLLLTLSALLSRVIGLIRDQADGFTIEHVRGVG